jgi:hypothetical protein
MPTIEGQPHGRRGRVRRLTERLKESPRLERASRKLMGGEEVQA